MGSGISTEFHFLDEPVKSHHQSYSDLFNQACPYFMSIGVSYNDFWHNDEFEICKYALQAEKISQRRRNSELWLNSVYMFRALIDASPAFHDFGDGKSHEIKFSVEEPFPLSKEEAEEKEEQKQIAFSEEFAKRMQAIARIHNQKIEEKTNKK